MSNSMGLLLDGLAPRARDKHVRWSFSWALVSEPGFLKFQIFRFSILEFLFWKTFPKNMLVRYRGINNKGVLERPWTKWRVLRAISTTLKCQFTGKC